MALKKIKKGREKTFFSSLSQIIYSLKLSGIGKRYEVLVLLISLLVSGLSEALLISSIVPIVNSFSKIETNIEDINNHQLYIINSVIIFLFIIIIATLARVICLYYGCKLSAIAGNDLGVKAFSKFTNQNYRDHIQTSSSNFTAALTKHLDYTILSFELLSQLILSAIIIISITISLIKSQPYLAIYVFSCISVCYILIVNISFPIYKKNSIVMAKGYDKVLKTLQEAYNGKRDIILDNSQRLYVNSYKEYDLKLRKAGIVNNFLRNSPRIVIEGVGYLLLSIAILISITKNIPATVILGSLSTVAIASQRLLPAFQNIYSTISSIKSYEEDIKIINKFASIKNKVLNQNKNINYHPNKLIHISNLSFSYSNKGPNIIEDLNLKIDIGDKIGIVGKSGSGKSTLLDIILGLLEPDKGKIIFDNSLEIKNLCYDNWRSKIGHVPQNIYLFNKSIEENISISEKGSKINKENLQYAIKASQLEKWIKELKYGSLTKVTENGSKFSGGQRQRVGIARALYRRPKILVLDEATSSLDKFNESQIINEINKSQDNITLIIVSHNIDSLNICDEIYEMKNKSLIRLNE